MKLFFSPDGKAMRLIISHRGEPGTPEALARIDAIKEAAEEALKQTPLKNAKNVSGRDRGDLQGHAKRLHYDLLIAGVAALCLIFIIMVIITRGFIAALVIVGTVALSLGASFGLSVLIWQHILGIELHWLVLAMSVIILLAVGSDYNLLLVSRMKEEIGAGHKHGHHPGNGRYRQGGDVGGPGVRVHDDFYGGQRSAHHRPSGYHHWAGSVVRHVGGACVHDAVNRRAAGTLVLVAADSASPPGQHNASSVRTPPAGTFSAQERSMTSSSSTGADAARSNCRCRLLKRNDVRPHSR